MGTLDVQSKTQGSVAVLAVRGTVDGFSAPNLEKELARMLDIGKKFVVVNLADTDFMSSAGWATLVVALHRLKPQGGKLVLAQMNSSVAQVYDALDFKAVLKTFPTEQEALTALKEPERK